MANIFKTVDSIGLISILRNFILAVSLFFATKTEMDVVAESLNDLNVRIKEAIPTIAVGSVTTGKEGTQASVNNSGTPSAAIFDFVIPKGDKGISITTASINSFGYLIVQLSNGQTINAGYVKGADGTSINIKGSFNSTNELPSSNQQLGDCYLINGNLWVYTNSFESGSVNGFVNVGNIQGPAGRGITSAGINLDGLLVLTYSDNNQVTLGNVVGNDGVSAGFGTPTASVDSNTGTPSVTVKASGPDTAKIFNFNFLNLKGEPGTAATIKIGTVTTGDENSEAKITKTGTDQNAILNFVIPRGKTGDMHHFHDKNTDTSGKVIAYYCTVDRIWEIKPKASSNYNYDYVGKIQLPIPSEKAMLSMADCISMDYLVSLSIEDARINASYTWSNIHWQLQCSDPSGVVYTTRYSTDHIHFYFAADSNRKIINGLSTIEIVVRYEGKGVVYVQASIENDYGRAYYNGSGIFYK